MLKIDNSFKTLCFSPYNVLEIYGHCEITILKALMLRGATVRYVLCNGVFSACDLYNCHVKRPVDACEWCKNIVADKMSELNMEYQWLGQYIRFKEYIVARAWAKSLSSESLFDATYGYWRIGEWVRSSIMTSFRIINLDAENHEVKETYREYLYSGLIASFALDRLLEQYNPNVVLIFNGRSSSLRIMLEICKLKKIRFIVYERGVAYGTLSFVKNVSRFDLTPIKNIWADWDNIPLTNNELQKMDLTLDDRAKGKNLNWRVISPVKENEDYIIRKFNISKTKPIFAFFTSSEDEIIAEKQLRKRVFPSQVEWLSETIKFACSHRDIKFIIRLHPLLGSKAVAGPSAQQLDYIKHLISLKSDNVIFVAPDEEDISTYDIMSIATIGFASYSTAGLEMACLGKPVVVVADSFYNFCEFVKKTNSTDDYYDIMEISLNLPLNKTYLNIKRNSYRFFYLLLYRHDIHFPLFKLTDYYKGVLTYSSLDELMPGREPNLDRICRIILEDEPVCLPPSDIERNRSEEEETLWFRKNYPDLIESTPSFIRQ